MSQKNIKRQLKKKQNVRRQLRYDPTSKLNITPGSSGMPFPPYYFDGPHFHAPVTVIQNTISNKFKRLKRNPVPIQNYIYDDDKTNIKEINEMLRHTELKLDGIPSNQDTLDEDLKRLYQSI